MSLLVKDPNARIEYCIDWDTLRPGLTAISASSWLVSPQTIGSLAVEADRIDGAKAFVTTTGGEIGRVYELTNSAVFATGETDERSLTIRVEQR